jgi:hypothetical protein
VVSLAITVAARILKSQVAMLLKARMFLVSGVLVDAFRPTDRLSNESY